MKIRRGFVSNSSSSSFVLFGKELTISEALKNKNVWVLGTQLSDGTDFFELTDEMRETISDIGISEYSRFFTHVITNSESFTIDQKDIEKLSKAAGELGIITVVTFEKDYHCTETIEQFRERYLD